MRASAMNIRRTCLFIGMLMLLGGCAHHYTPEAFASPYGFLSGIWHGIAFPYALLANLLSWIFSLFGVRFLADIQIVGRPNTGFLFYYVGFFIGFSMYGGAGAASKG